MDIKAAKDRGETVSLMEPLLIGSDSRHRPELTDLAIELAAKSAGFRRSLPDSLLSPLADLVRAMNCYYSNLIEGHDTHPVDIERALKGDYSKDAKERDLQLEAKAHIAVQQWIDTGGLEAAATTVQSMVDIHRRFCGQLPEDLLWVEDPATKEKTKVVPGELRQREVAVGRHIPVSARAVPRFLQRYDEAYSTLGKTDTIISTAAAHHRLLHCSGSDTVLEVKLRHGAGSVERHARSDDAVDQVREFAHDSADHCFRREPISTQSITEVPQCRIVPARDQPRHVKRVA